MAIRYTLAKAGVTRRGMASVNTFWIIGLATDMRPMPPVARRVAVDQRSQNWGVLSRLSTGTLAPLALGGL